MKLLVCDPVDSEAVAAMRAAGIDVDVNDDITAEELEEIIPQYEAMIVRSRTKAREPLIDKASNLKAIIRPGVGLDNIDVEYAESKGIEVRNTPAASSNAVAELTIGYLFALARPIVEATVSMKEGKWEKKQLKGTELAGKTLGLIGFGRIGSLVGQKADGLGMEVLFHRRTDIDVDFATQVPLDELLERADYISLHLPHTPATHYIIDEGAFAKMKDGVKIVNCARGGTVDEDALYDAIQSGKVAGAALDVFEDEAEERGQKLMQLPQVIGSPHIGAGTAEAKARLGEEAVRIAIEIAERS
ncbi:MAG: D-2-hydroxyacid dehydrogenase [Chloroflexota bacterium]|nr:D-2-hydroxyacid dehydrogenase [Chloroflexota bacterium]